MGRGSVLTFCLMKGVHPTPPYRSRREKQRERVFRPCSQPCPHPSPLPKGEGVKARRLVLSSWVCVLTKSASASLQKGKGSSPNASESRQRSREFRGRGAGRLSVLRLTPSRS